MQDIMPKLYIYFDKTFDIFIAETRTKFNLGIDSNIRIFNDVNIEAQQPPDKPGHMTIDVRSHGIDGDVEDIDDFYLYPDYFRYKKIRNTAKMAIFAKCIDFQIHLMVWNRAITLDTFVCDFDEVFAKLNEQ